VARAREKGARESLVLLDELAFVVSIRNRTVITALQPSTEGVFTSIDSAVIA
jgi:flagellar operon protein